MRASKAFVLLTAIGVLAILGMAILALVVNVDFSYRYVHHRATQRELAGLLHDAAERLRANSTILGRLQTGGDPVTVLSLESDRRKIVVRARRASNVHAANLGGARSTAVALEAFDEASPKAPRRYAVYLIEPETAPILLAQFARAQGGAAK